MKWIKIIPQQKINIWSKWKENIRLPVHWESSWERSYYVGCHFSCGKCCGLLFICRVKLNSEMSKMQRHEMRPLEKSINNFLINESVCVPRHSVYHIYCKIITTEIVGWQSIQQCMHLSFTLNVKSTRFVNQILWIDFCSVCFYFHRHHFSTVHSWIW